MTSRFIFLIVVLNILFCTELGATHNRAGEITYVQLNDLTIRATITTYTRTSSFAADRDSLTLFWGDGTSSSVLRSNDQGTELPNDIKLNFYVAEHTYPTRGTYKLSMEDPNRIAGILNVDFPNSVNIPFYIETTLTLLDTRFQGENSSAVLLQPPIDYACINEVFTHNPNAYDPDGDSLSYELIVPFESEGAEVPNYLLPDEVNPGPENMVSLDPITGDFIWNSPKISGEFNVTIRISEYREGRLINNIIRDMQILVRSCPGNNNPPEIDVIDELCVIAGETIDLTVIGTDADSGQLLTMTALGGPFELSDSPAEFFTDQNPGVSGLESRFVWNTNCSHISKEYYQVVFKAVDDFFDFEQSGLATLRSIRIRVVGPSPEDIQAERESGNIKISWTAPYACENDALFQGFSVWRRIGTTEIPPDTCVTGLEGYGYEQIIFLTAEQENGRYIAFDAEVGESNIYCYRILAEFASLSQANNPFNKVESLPSEEVCIRFDRKDPLITNVTVRETDMMTGSIEIRWLPPKAEDFDTLLFPGPYTTEVWRADGQNSDNFELIPDARFSAPSFAEITDTSFVDTILNTSETTYRYQVRFLTGEANPVTIPSQPASSVFLEAVGRDEQIDLNWAESVPWNNTAYTIFQQNPTGEFDSIGRSLSPQFSVTGLQNGIRYCFRIESSGTYGLSSVSDPLLNDSQISCTTPVDSIPPCAPTLSVETICARQLVDSEQTLINTLNWSFSNGGCSRAADLASFNIYYSPEEGDPFELIDQVNASANRFDHQLDDVIAGCYVITAVDSSGNEGSLSTVFCVDNCPKYELGNTFTPNNDQANDLFIPRINLFIDRIELDIYNRWGELVFQTTDPAINWNGRTDGGKTLADGTYFYSCKVFEKRVSGVVERPDLLTGYIQILRGN